ncbi:MAG: exodeoxyribonuclease VII large subunit [Phycisphaerales bacterium]
MSRLPFDGGRTAAKKALGDQPTTSGGNLSVTQLATLVAQTVSERVPRPLRVIGEVSNFTDRTHWYFNLKDAGSAISCVMFQSAARKAGFTPAVGQEVVVTGFVDYYVPQGKLTFRVDHIDPVGAGALELAFRKLCDELRALGWFDPSTKRPLPVFPRRVAVITSRTGAALQDVLDTARRRAPFVEIMLLDTLVQGPGAAPGVARAIGWLSANAARLAVDALIVTRGGGSMEDLWAFNDRAVAEAIRACTIPVAAAIGHETDTTIAELVADLRCATPTQAAMRATPDRAALVEQTEAGAARLTVALCGGFQRSGAALVSSSRQLASGARNTLLSTARRLDALAARVEAHRPVALYERRQASIMAAAVRLRAAMQQQLANIDPDELGGRLVDAGVRALRSRQERLSAAARALELVGPASVLARGFSVTFDSAGRIIRRAQDAQPGEAIVTKVAEGTINSVVRGLADVGVRHGERRSKRPKNDVEGQQRLFGGEAPPSE